MAVKAYQIEKTNSINQNAYKKNAKSSNFAAQYFKQQTHSKIP